MYVFGHTGFMVCVLWEMGEVECVYLETDRLCRLVCSGIVECVYFRFMELCVGFLGGGS